MARLLALATLLSLAALLTLGCGGGGVRTSQDRLGGRLAVHVAWPPRGATRVIPGATGSVVVRVLQGATVVAQATLLPAAPTTTITELPAGLLTVRATAFPAADGTGTPLAVAQIPATVAADATGNVDLALASTIDHLTILPSPINLALLGILTSQTTVTAYDAANAVVLTAPGDLGYASSGLGVFLVSPTGLVTGLAVGTATLTVTDAVSGKSATASVRITLH